MVKVEVKKHYHQIGCAPTDLNFQVEIKFIDDDNTEKFVYGIADPTYSEYGVSTKSIFSHIEGSENFFDYMVENYDDFDECKESKYLSLFEDVDFVLGKYQEEILEKLKDTKYSGPRCGASLDQNGTTYYIESCSHISATDTYYYIQIKCNKGKYHYSVTDKSIFLRMQMGAVYNSFYEDEEVKYYITTDNLDDLVAIPYMKEDALCDLDILKGYMEEVK